jgi:hypothetical protein
MAKTRHKIRHYKKHKNDMVFKTEHQWRKAKSKQRDFYAKRGDKK